MCFSSFQSDFDPPCPVAPAPFERGLRGRGSLGREEQRAERLQGPSGLGAQPCEAEISLSSLESAIEPISWDTEVSKDRELANVKTQVVRELSPRSVFFASWD